ncbi:hypothetical protein B0H14DRAFT_2461835, partial [Mycena olivaceomarginata]
MPTVRSWASWQALNYGLSTSLRQKSMTRLWLKAGKGLLIFDGLFSASLTAFLIESYRSLTPDQGAITIAVLAQISLQLDPNSDIKSGAIVTSSFTPSTSSLACNTLWFLS